MKSKYFLFCLLISFLCFVSFSTALLSEDLGQGVLGRFKQALEDKKFCKEMEDKSGLKSCWDELIGVDGDKAKEIILSERPDLEEKFVQLIPASHPFVTKDFRENRVRIFLNEDGKVKTSPKIG